MRPHCFSRSRRLLRLLPLIALLAVILPTSARAQQPPDSRRLAAQRAGAAPHTDGTYVVWADLAPDGTPTIYGADTRQSSPTPFVVTTLSDRRIEPSAYRVSIASGLVTWGDFRAGSWNVYARRLPSGPEISVAASGSDETLPATDGERVAYVLAGPLTSSSASVKVVTLSSGATSSFDITTENWALVSLTLDGPRVRWVEVFRSHSWRLRQQALGASSATTLVERSGFFKGYDLHGDVFVYASANDELQLLNLATGATMLLSGAAVAPTTDGRYVVYTLVGASGGALAGYDLANDARWVIAAENTASNGGPSLGGGRLAWTRSDERGRSVHVAPMSVLVPSAWRYGETGPGQIYFATTGHTLGGVLRRFWEGSGGLPVFGFPLTEEYSELNRDTREFYTTQYVERQRLEHHPELAGTPYEVLLGRLGVEQLQRMGRRWELEPRANPTTPHFYPQTGHAIAPQFWDYWRTHGLELGDAGVSEREALALWGYPITEPQLETNSSGHTVLTQWFERARFEYHPGNPEPHKVLLGRLGAEILAGKGW